MSLPCRTNVVGLVLLFLSMGGATAFGQAGTASVVGEVRDQQAAAVPGAAVTTADAATRAERSSTTDRASTNGPCPAGRDDHEVKVG
jgi:hypothetical protein